MKVARSTVIAIRNSRRKVAPVTGDVMRGLVIWAETKILATLVAKKVLATRRVKHAYNIKPSVRSEMIALSIPPPRFLRLPRL